MNITKEKQEIIDALKERDEEWLILAFKKLLDIDHPSYSTEHRFIIEERLEAYNKAPENLISLEELKQTLHKEGRL